MKTALFLICLAQAAFASPAHEDLRPETQPALYQVLDMQDGIRTEGWIPKDRLGITHIGDMELTRRLWNDYASVFEFKDWNNFDPAAPYRPVVLELEGKRIVLRSRHPIIEKDPGLVVTSRGVENLNGLGRAEVLRSGDLPYLKKREAFDAIVAACVAKRTQQDVNYENAIRQNRELEERRRKDARTSMIKFYIFLFIGAGMVWLFPAWAAIRAVARKGGCPLKWTIAICALSPTGWVVWTGWPNVRGWMGVMSVLTAYAALWASGRIAASAEKTGPSTRWTLPLSAAIILGYGLWTFDCSFKYHSWCFMGGSGERATLGELSALRSSLSVYSGDTEGKWPADLDSLIPKYLSKIPATHPVVRGGVILHPPSGKVRISPSANDSGGWGYAPEEGRIYINCTHMDLKERTKLSDY